MNDFDRLRLAIWQDQLAELDAAYKARALTAYTEEALARLREEYKRVAGPIKRQIAAITARCATPS